MGAGASVRNDTTTWRIRSIAISRRLHILLTIISFGHEPPVKSMTFRRHALNLNKGKEGERIAKVIARAGLCSRRDAERWIADGRVSVNGKMLDTPAFTVGPDDRIIVDGRPLPASEAPRLFLYHKPAGLVTTVRDEKNRPTVFAHLPPGMPRVVSVGRLDLTSEGLLLLTNDGGLARYLELPANALQRCYRVRLHGACKGRPSCQTRTRHHG